MYMDYVDLDYHVTYCMVLKKLGRDGYVQQYQKMLHHFILFLIEK